MSEMESGGPVHREPASIGSIADKYFSAPIDSGSDGAQTTRGEDLVSRLGAEKAGAYRGLVRALAERMGKKPSQRAALEDVYDTHDIGDPLDLDNLQETFSPNDILNTEEISDAAREAKEIYARYNAAKIDAQRGLPPDDEDFDTDYPFDDDL